MIKKIKEFGQIIYLARKKNIPMRKKLMLQSVIAEPAEWKGAVKYGIYVVR